MKQSNEIDKILQLKTIWAKMMDTGFIGLDSVIEPYEDLLCETFEGCWLHNYWHMPRDDSGKKYWLLSDTDSRKKYFYTLKSSTDEDGRKDDCKISWEIFFYELILSERLMEHIYIYNITLL